MVQVGVPDTGSLVLVALVCDGGEGGGPARGVLSDGSGARLPVASRNEFGIFRPGVGGTCHRIFSVLAAAVLPEVVRYGVTRSPFRVERLLLKRTE